MTTDPAIWLLAARERARQWDPLGDLFPQQRAFVLDPAKRKTARCTRRAGKTKSLAHYLLREAMTGADAACVYVALTRLVAKRQVWEECLRVISDHKLNATINHSELFIRFGRRAPIIFTGADDEAQIEKLRGHKFKLAAIDEAQSFPPYIRKLVYEVLSPALMDVEGTLVMAGTPGPRLDGLFYEATTTLPGWSRHRWSVLDNPHVADAARKIEQEKAARGWTEQTPAFLREYRGEWVRSDDELVYHYDPALNDYDALPRVEHHVLSMDVGYRDRTAFVVSAYGEYDPALYVVSAEAHGGMVPTDIATRIKALREQYRPEAIVMDCGALGLGYAEEFRQKHHLPIEAADKREKLSAIEFLNGDMRRGLIKAKGDSPLVEEWRTLQYDDKGKEDPHQRNDLADAFLYGYRRARHYLAREPDRRDDAARFEDMAEINFRKQMQPQADEWGTY